MSLTRPSSISSDEITVTVAGTLITDFSERVAVTVTLSTSTASAGAVSAACATVAIRAAVEAAANAASFKRDIDIPFDDAVAN